MSKDNRPNDYYERQQALDITRSWIVQAPAGSGKTGILVYRMMKLLAVTKRPEEVLAITFTRKAAKEMRDRLLELLQAADQQKTSDDAFEQQGLQLAHEVLKNDAEHNWQLLNIPHRLNIDTIDALSARLVSTMPWLSRLGDRPQTTENPTTHFQFAVEQLLLELIDKDSDTYQLLQDLMLSLDNNFSKIRNLLIPMLGKRDQWLRHFLGKDLQRSRSDLEEVWRSVSQTMLAELLDATPFDIKDEVVRLAHFAANQRIDVEMQKLPRDRDPSKLDFTFHIFTSEQRFPRADFADINLWAGIRDFLLTNGKLRKRVDVRHGFPKGASEKEQFVDLLNRLENETQFIEKLANVAMVPPSDFSEEQWQQLLTLEKILRRLLSHLQLRFHNARECDFSEIALRANQALIDLGQPTDLALRMDYQIQHILVDEFQDTSHSQSTLLENLTRGWQQQDGRSLFLVGDPMQSIYRFREADVGLFVKLSDGRGKINDIQLHSLTLSENFRSKKALVDWFNDVFTACFPKHNNETTGAIQYALASSRKTLGNAPIFNAFHSDEQEAEFVVQTVRNALERGDKKIAILVRNRSQLAPILPVLNAADIVYEGIDIKPFNKTQDVLDVLSLCKALLRLDDKVAWLSLLRGPWLGLSLVEITEIAQGKDIVIWERLNNPDRLSTLSQGSRYRLEQFRKVMQLALQQKQRVPLASLVQWLWKELGGEACLHDITVEDLAVVWRLIKELDQGGDIEKMSDLDDGLEGLYAQPAKKQRNIEQSVIISTIHKAKGLQYDTVILPGLSRKGANHDRDILRWAEVVDSSGQERLLIATLDAKQQSNSHYQYLRNLEKQRESNEQLRLLYVACTRAEKNLYLSGTFYHHKRTGELTARGLGQSLLNGIWPTIGESFHLDTLDDQSESENAFINQTLYRLPDDFLLSKSQSIDWNASETIATKDLQTEISYDWAGSVAQATGIVLHNWLEHHADDLVSFEIDHLQKRRWQLEFQSMRLDASQVRSAVKRMTTAITNMKNDATAQWIFSEKTHSDIHNEFPISTVEEGKILNFRIDRTFIDKTGIRWIIDYKSTTHFEPDVDEFIDQQIDERGYKYQLESYARAFSRLESNPIKLGVYFPLLKQWRTWRFDQ